MDFTGPVAIIEVLILLEHVEKFEKLKTNQDVIGITYSDTTRIFCGKFAISICFQINFHETLK